MTRISVSEHEIWAGIGWAAPGEYELTNCNQESCGQPLLAGLPTAPATTP